MNLLSRALGLQRAELLRALPFFSVYLLLFTALTVADGVAVSLFASRIGADSLPLWYAATAVLSLVLISLYLTQATRRSGDQMFGWILAVIALLFLGAWWVHQQRGGLVPLGTLFVTREIALTMVLMHFGTFLQDYFLRSELNRILPIIYAGGRVGGIIGGGALGSLAQRFGTIQLVPGIVLLLLVAWAGILWIARVIPPRDEEAAEAAALAGGASAAGIATTPGTLAADARAVGQPVDVSESSWDSVRRFLRTVIQCPLLGWLTATTLLFIGCRWFLAYQYTAHFEHHFADDVALAGFLGRYTQIALLISLVLQLFVVNRLVRWLGVSATHFLYSVLVMGGLLGNLFASGLAVAVASRFLESELRFGLRNPVNQMMVNRFPKRTRIVVRGWSLGWLIPVGTLIASGLIASLLAVAGPVAVAVVGVVLGVGFVVAARRAGIAYDSPAILGTSPGGVRV